MHAALRFPDHTAVPAGSARFLSVSVQAVLPVLPFSPALWKLLSAAVPMLTCFAAVFPDHPELPLLLRLILLCFCQVLPVSHSELSDFVQSPVFPPGFLPVPDLTWKLPVPSEQQPLLFRFRAVLFRLPILSCHRQAPAVHLPDPVLFPQMYPAMHLLLSDWFYPAFPAESVHPHFL